MPKETRRVAQDIDECLFNSVKKHYVELTALGKKLGWTDVPTYEEVCRLGGTHKAYGHYPDYPTINERMRNDEGFNRNQEVIAGSLDALQFMQSILLVYLTTRPEHLAQISYEELMKAGFPDRPVIARPSSVPLEKTAEWKLWQLAELAKQTQSHLVMIDDSLSMHKSIRQSGRADVSSILFAGPITPTGNGEQTWIQIKEREAKA